MKEKKSHGVQLLMRTIVRDPNGKVISDTGEKPTSSFVIAFLKFVSGLFDGINVSATDITNTSRTICAAAENAYRMFGVKAPINDDTHGIVVGTGDTAEDNLDYKLATQLTEGTGAGNITHGEQIHVTPTVVGANVDMVLKRAFTNGTGSTITVKEAGIYTERYPSYSHCIVRDVFAAGVDVPDKCSLTTIYTVRTTV